MKVCIIGAGASGIIAAIKALENNHEVTIIERNNKVLKKLLLTGNGRCNFWNEEMNTSKYNTSDYSILEKILNSQKNKVLDFFSSLGIVYKSLNGYYYPFSNQATSIYNALLNKVISLKANIVLNTTVKKIKKENNKFIIKTDNQVFFTDKVILATGLLTRSNLGCDSIGINIAKSFGHTINPLHPALVQLVGSDAFYKDWDGIRSEAILSLYEDKIIKKQEYGEVQLTSYGLSGIVAFNLSSLVNQGLSKNHKIVIKINFAPWCKNQNELKNYLDVKSILIPDFTLSQILEGFLNYKLVNLIYKLLKLKPDCKWEDIKQEELLKLIINFPVNIIKTKDYDASQVTSGGIPLAEINPKTMESKIVKNLYLTGEILDVDGLCGGYNLGFAWMTGLIAGENI